MFASWDLAGTRVSRKNCPSTARSWVAFQRGKDGQVPDRPRLPYRWGRTMSGPAPPAVWTRLVGHPGTPHRIPGNAASLEEGFGKQLYRKPLGPNSIRFAVLRSPSTGRIENPPRAQGARPARAAVAGGGPGEPTPHSGHTRLISAQRCGRKGKVLSSAYKCNENRSLKGAS